MRSSGTELDKKRMREQGVLLSQKWKRVLTRSIWRDAFTEVTLENINAVPLRRAHPATCVPCVLVDVQRSSHTPLFGGVSSVRRSCSEELARDFLLRLDQDVYHNRDHRRNSALLIQVGLDGTGTAYIPNKTGFTELIMQKTFCSKASILSMPIWVMWSIY